MEWKETRGRKVKHEFNLKPGQAMSVPFNATVRALAYRYGRKNGLKIRTSKAGDILKIWCF